MKTALKTALLLSKPAAASPPAPPTGLVTGVTILNDISVNITNPTTMSVQLQTNGTAILIETGGTEVIANLDRSKIRVQVADPGWNTDGSFNSGRLRMVKPRLPIYGPTYDVAIYQPTPGKFWIKMDDFIFNQDAIWKSSVIEVQFDSDWIPGASAEIFSGASVVRNDSLPYPDFSVRPLDLAWQRAGVGDTIPLDLAVINEFASDNSMVACVEGYAVDGNGNKGTLQRRSTMVQSPYTPTSGAWHPADIPAPTYPLNLPMPTTGTPTYRAERRYIVKPWVGPPWCSAAETVNGVDYAAKGVAYPTFNPPIGVPFCFDFDNSHVPIYGLIAQDPAGATIASSTNVATVSTAGLCKTLAGALAAAVTYADYATFLTAVRRLNNTASALTILADSGSGTTTYQRPTNHVTIYGANGSVAGGVGVLRDVVGSTPGTDTGCYSVRVSTASTTNFPPGYVAAEMRSQTGYPSDLCRLRGRNFDGTTPASKSMHFRMLYRGIYFDSEGVTVAADHTITDCNGDLSTPTEIQACYQMYAACKWRSPPALNVGANDINWRAGFRYYHQPDIYPVKTSTQFRGGITSTAGPPVFVGGLIKAINTGTGYVNIPTTAVVGCKLDHISFSLPAAASATNAPSQVQPLVTHAVILNVEQGVTGSPVTSGWGVGGDHPSRVVGAANVLLKHTGATYSGPSWGLANDGHLREVDSLVMFGCGQAFKTVNPVGTGDGRANLIYQDQGWIRLNKRARMMACYFPQVNSKGNNFNAPETPNTPAVAWSSTASYWKGTIVSDSGIAYQAKQNIPANSGILLSDTDYWYTGTALATAYGRQPLRMGNDDYLHHVGCWGNVAGDSTQGVAPGPGNGTIGTDSWYGMAWGSDEAYETGSSDFTTNWFADRANANFTPKAGGRLVNRIPAGKAWAPFDLYGTPIPNDGTGAAGPIQIAA